MAHAPLWLALHEAYHGFAWEVAARIAELSAAVRHRVSARNYDLYPRHQPSRMSRVDPVCNLRH